MPTKLICHLIFFAECEGPLCPVVMYVGLLDSYAEHTDRLCCATFYRNVIRRLVFQVRLFI
jgi:hypothetical protein